MSSLHHIGGAERLRQRGVDGKVAAIRWAREERVPFLGLCLGMQCAVIEWIHNQAGLAGAISAELDPESPHPVIQLLPEQQDMVDLGGTLGQGLYGELVACQRHLIGWPPGGADRTEEPPLLHRLPVAPRIRLAPGKLHPLFHGLIEAAQGRRGAANGAPGDARGEIPLRT